MPRASSRNRSSGKVAVSAPRLFRWEYVKPYPQLIVADGKKVWVYDPDLQQVSVRPQGEEEQNSPLAVLIDPSKLDAQFVVKEAGAADGLNWLSLAPKDGNDAGLRSARLGFGKTGLVEDAVRRCAGPAHRDQLQPAGSAIRRLPAARSGTPRPRAWT